MSNEMEIKFKVGDPVYYRNPKGDTVPTRVTRVGYGNKVKLAQIDLSGEYCGHREGWVPKSKVELQKEDL